MAIKLGHRVTVRPGVSNCRDEGSLSHSRQQARTTGDPSRGEEGIPRKHLEGLRGEVVQIGRDCLDVKDGQGRSLGEKPADVPPGHEDRVLVDSQVVNGVRQGR